MPDCNIDGTAMVEIIDPAQKEIYHITIAFTGWKCPVCGSVKSVVAI